MVGDEEGSDHLEAMAYNMDHALGTDSVSKGRNDRKALVVASSVPWEEGLGGKVDHASLPWNKHNVSLSQANTFNSP